MMDTSATSDGGRWRHAVTPGLTVPTSSTPSASRRSRGRSPEVVRLRDGRTVTVRPISADDGERLTAFHHHLSPETVRRRFFTAHPTLSANELHHFTHVDGDRRLALVAVVDDGIVGVGRYDSLTVTDEVEVAFVVRDDHQGVGLGSLLLERIAAAAAAHGKRRLRAEMLPENTAMHRAFRHLDGAVHAFRDGIVEVTAPLTPDP